MLFVSDVHDSPGALRRLVALGEEVVILGDLVNLTDYRTGLGAVGTVLGVDFAARASAARARGDYEAMRAMWSEETGLARDEVRRRIGEELTAQYQRAAEALNGGHGLVIHGNVDRPEVLRESLPSGFSYVHGEVHERAGFRLGFVGGGIRTPLRADGEVSDEEMEDILESLGPVDVLCTHVPPALEPLRRDVITGREERGSDPVREYLRRHQPSFHLFGDVHQPQASTWRVGRTRCVNAGYFRATGRFVRLDGTGVTVGTVG
jgi:Icc-related predicted phosphoesterase